MAIDVWMGWELGEAVRNPAALGAWPYRPFTYSVIQTETCTITNSWFHQVGGFPATGHAMQMTTTNNPGDIMIYCPNPGPDKEVRFILRLDEYEKGHLYVAFVNGVSEGWQSWLYMLNDRILIYEDGDGILHSAVAPLAEGQDYEIKIRATIAAAGSVTVYVDGVAVITTGTVNTRDSFEAEDDFSWIEFVLEYNGTIEPYPIILLDDFVVSDWGELTSTAKFCLGMYPTEDESIESTPTTGSTVWNLVSEDPLDDADGSLFVSGDIDVLIMSNIQVTGVVWGVATLTRFFGTDTDPDVELTAYMGMMVGVVSDEVIGLSDSQAPSYIGEGDYVTIFGKFMTNPATETAWTGQTLSLAKMQLQAAVEDGEATVTWAGWEALTDALSGEEGGLEDPEVEAPGVDDSVYVTLALPMTMQITTSSAPAKLTGLFATDRTIGGWLWDRRRLQSEELPSTRHNSFMGGILWGLRDGTVRDHWVCGSSHGTEYQDIEYYRGVDHCTWTPRVQVGRYSVFSDGRRLYSDHSRSHVLLALVDGLQYVDLQSDAVHESVTVSQYRRLDDQIISLYRGFEFVEEFTGEVLEEGGREDVEVDGVIDVSKIASREQEFIIRDNRLMLNGEYRKTIGGDSDFLEVLEYQGELYGQGRAAYCEYFPVDASTCRVLVDEDDTVYSYTRVETLNFSEPSQRHFTVDQDLGIIYIGGDTAPDLVLSQDVSVSAITIPFYRNTEAQYWPDQGILQIGSEKILYLEKGIEGFYQCIRGYSATTVVEHETGALITNPQRGYAATGELYIAYDSVPRVDYETSDYELRSANKSSWLDIKPSYQVDTQAVLQIQNKERSCARIELVVDAPSLGGTLYGPAYYGTAATRLTAIAYDYQDQVVEDLDVTISITTGGGTLNGQYGSVQDTTNAVGEIYATYNNAFIRDNIELIVDEVVHDGSDTRMNVALPEGIVADEVWVYQVLKHDNILGTTGLAREITAYSVAAEPYGSSYVEIEGLMGPEYINGILSVFEGGVTRVFRNIRTITTELDGDDLPISRLYLDDTLTSVVGETCRLLQAEALQWDSGALNGMRKILYEYTEEAQHPITGEPGAYMPVRPDELGEDQLVFLDRLLPVPDPEDDSMDLGAYALITNSMAKFIAMARDPATGVLITSNEIRLRIVLPSTMIGVDLQGALPIPYGWTLATDEFNVGAAVGGANFISVNPRAENINSFCMLAEIP